MVARIGRVRAVIEVWPVIHVRDAKLALANVVVAVGCSCDGAFLISHDGDDALVDTLVGNCRAAFRSFKVGVNYLTCTTPLDAYRRGDRVRANAVWVDDSGIRTGIVPGDLFDVVHMMRRTGSPVFFAGIAHKGPSLDDPDPAKSADQARALGFVPVTTGTATGIAADPEKLAAMGWPLALASGVMPANAAVYAPLVSHVLVSTGISRDFHTFDADKLRALMRALRHP